MQSDLFQQLDRNANWHEMLDGIRALEKLIGREVESIPTGTVEVTHTDRPDLLLEGEKVVFHFGGLPDGVRRFEAGDVVVQIFSGRRELDVKLACSLALGHPYKERGDSYHPLRAEVPDLSSHALIDQNHDGALYRFLVGRDERAAQIFRAFWRLEMGPVILGRNDEIVGALYS